MHHKTLRYENICNLDIQCLVWASVRWTNKWVYILITAALLALFFPPLTKLAKTLHCLLESDAAHWGQLNKNIGETKKCRWRWRLSVLTFCWGFSTSTAKTYHKVRGYDCSDRLPICCNVADGQLSTLRANLESPVNLKTRTSLYCGRKPV